VSLGFLLLTACARLAGAQTYVWTDEHGVVHAAADPSEVPANQRAKAIRDAAGRRNPVTISPADESGAVPAAPAPAPSPTARKGHSAPAPEPRSYEGDAPAEAETSGGGAGLEANPKVTPPPKGANETPKTKDVTGKRLPPPDPGFEWHCATDPEGGPPNCEQFEKKTSKRERRAEARRKAKEDLGVGDPTDEFDPDVAKRVDERAEEEFKKSTPVPTTRAPKHVQDDDESESQDETQD
jgi:hypothetical protein